MTTDFKATTASGSIYESIDGRVYVNGKYVHNAVIRSFRLQDHPEGPIDVDWLESIEPGNPKVGEHIYLNTYGDYGWRISTEVMDSE